MPKLFLFVILAVAPLCAEFLRIEQTVTGLECMSCAESAPKRLKRIKGVQDATFRTSDSVAVLELKPGNTVALADIRDAVKNMGYTPTIAKVKARGEARLESGKWVFQLAGTDAKYPLDLPTPAEIERQLRQGGVWIVEGSLADPKSPIQVSGVWRAE